ncbi:MAG: VOC family protein [Phycisphaerales bacterium JB059]
MERLTGILETVLYADDLDAAEGFYTGVLGLPRVGEGSTLMRTFRVGPRQVLLVFDPAESKPTGRDVPSHGARGPGHVALLVGEGELPAWRDRLTAQGVQIEQEVEWDWGDTPHRSLYVRDPAGNSVELITGDIWAS